jgi:hypothetical protein
MAFDPSNDYTPLENFDSSPPLGNSEGVVQPVQAAAGFGYAKRVLRMESVPTQERDYTTPPGFWRVTLRESAAPDSRILFEQKVTLAILSVFDGSGGVTFIPLYDGGKFETSIVNGEPVSKDANGHYEGWRHVDTPRPTPFSEIAIPIFKPGSGATMDGIAIDIDWRGPNYKMDVPEGAVFRVEDDQWRRGATIPIAFFRGTILASANEETSLVDTRTGARWHLYIDAKSSKKPLRVIRSRQLRGSLEGSSWEFAPSSIPGSSGAAGVVEEDSKLGGLALLRLAGGTLGVLGVVRSVPPVLRMFVSTDEGEKWNRVMNTPLSISPLASCSIKNGAQILIYGVSADSKRDPAYALLAFGKTEGEGSQGEGAADSNGWTVVDSGQPTGSSLFPKKGSVKLEPGDGGVVRLLWRDESTGLLHCLATKDGGKTYAAEAMS